MLMGIQLQAHPTRNQKLILSQWMGCARFIWNAKCQDDNYLTTFARKFMPPDTYAPIDQKYSLYKDKELSPWLFDCPSQILRNSAVNWYNTYQDFIKNLCGKPRIKKKDNKGSIHLTKELFRFEKCEDGVTRLFIGSQRNNIGFLSIKRHQKFQEPKSIYIKKKNGRYTVSFVFDDGIDESILMDQGSYFKALSQSSREELEQITIGIDRGVTRPVQAGEDSFDFTPGQKKNKTGKEKYIKRLQNRLSKQKKGSRRRKRTKNKIARAYNKIVNIRKDFCHQTSRKLINNPTAKVYIFEDLRTKNMTKSSKGSIENPGKNIKAKSGLNRVILDKGWHMIEAFTNYKAHRAGKVIFKIPAQFTSQECAVCGQGLVSSPWDIHSGNRTSQALFLCLDCGNADNADNNAQKVIKKRAINLILHSGTELSKRGVLLGKGRGACTYGCETSKKKELSKVA
ncbi:MAG: transposase [Desulfobacterium sp.]|nr:transposase [Desulfobacterium sp.]